MDLGEARQDRRQLAPNPGRDALKRRHIQPLDLVQKPVVELVLEPGKLGRKLVEMQR